MSGYSGRVILVELWKQVSGRVFGLDQWSKKKKKVLSAIDKTLVFTFIKVLLEKLLPITKAPI